MIFKRLLLFVTPLFLFSSCGGGGEQEAAAAPAADTTGVKLYNAQPERVIGLARVEPEAKIVALYPVVSGRIAQVNVKLGQQVEKGAVLFELEHAHQDAQIQRIQAQLREQESQLPVIRASLQRAKIQAESAEASYRRIRQVYDQGAETKQRLDDADYALRTARQEIESVEAQLANARAALDVLNADLRLARVEVEDRIIRAPAQGRMLSVEVAPGFLALTTTVMGELAPLSAVTVRTEIDELFADEVHTGQAAYVRRQGSVDTLATGEVFEVAPSLKQKSLFSDATGTLEDRRVREVRVRIGKGADSLLLGARVECIIDVGN